MSYFYLSIDFGESYVGLAVSNGFLARPLDVFKYPQSNYSILRDHLISIVKMYNPQVIIVGVPSNEESFKKIVRVFSDFVFFDEHLKKKIVWFNEDYSTKEAILLKSRKRKREDSIAASIILENYFTAFGLSRSEEIV